VCPALIPWPPRLLWTSRSDRKAAYSPQIPLVHQFLFITPPSLPLLTHGYTFLLFPQPPLPALPQPLRSVLCTCTSQHMMCPRTHQKLFGRDTSIPHTTRFYPSFELPGPLPHYVCIRFGSHKHPTTNHSLFYLKTMMPPRSARSTRKTPPEAAAPYPPFGRHPSDPLEIRRSALPPTNPRPMPRDQPAAAPTTKPSSQSKSVSTVPQAKTICPWGCSATPTKATYPIFLNNASTTTTSSFTLGSSNAPSQQCHASLTTSRN
jgi:hypothetical protein